MKQIFIIMLTISLSINAYSQHQNLLKRFYQNQIKPSSEKSKTQLFAEINPQFFAFDGYGGGLGIEFSRFQTGLIYINTKLTPSFRDAIFNDAKNIEVPKNWAAEIFANIFLRKDRKGFYTGLIYSYDSYSVIDVPTKQKEDYTKSYIVTRAGFRWFPFKKYFYIDGGYGISFNINGTDKRTLGSSTYSPKQILGLPFFAVGGRFNLN